MTIPQHLFDSAVMDMVAYRLNLDPSRAAEHQHIAEKSAQDLLAVLGSQKNFMAILKKAGRSGEAEESVARARESILQTGVSSLVGFGIGAKLAAQLIAIAAKEDS
jgi:hypothetical protein